jgi:hypothetical protein
VAAFFIAVVHAEHVAHVADAAGALFATAATIDIAARSADPVATFGNADLFRDHVAVVLKAACSDVAAVALDTLAGAADPVATPIFALPLIDHVAVALPAARADLATIRAGGVIAWATFKVSTEVLTLIRA